MDWLQKVRKVTFVVFTILAALALMAVSVIGQDKYPSKPVTWVVGFGPGGVVGVTATGLAHAVEKILKQPIVMVYKPGAGTSIQLQFVKNSLPDGYTIGIFSPGGLINSHLRETPYEFFGDFDHLAQYGTYLFGIAVHPDSPFKTLNELVEYAKKNPGKLNYGAFSPGAPGTLLAESFAFLNGFKWTLISYDGDANVGASLLGKHVDVAVCTYNCWGPFTKAGKLRLLGVFYDQRWKDFPNVPTVKELGYKYSGGFGLIGLLGPKGLPENVKETLRAALREAMKDPEFLALMERSAVPVTYREGNEWVKYLEEFDKEMVTLMKQIGYKLIK
jgi:tripartite-type tricarboxylate transporter receptor subunit TctC